MHTKRRKQRHSKRRVGGQNSLSSSSVRSSVRSSRLSGSRLSGSRSSVRSSRLSGSRSSGSSSQCRQKIMGMFKQSDNVKYRTGLETLMHELSKYHPLAIIDFIEMHFNEKATLAHFNNDKCFKMMLDNFKRQLHEYKATFSKTKTTYPRFTMKDAESIMQKVYGIFTKVKLRGGAPGGDQEESDICPVCFDDLHDGSIVIHPSACQHLAHSKCLRTWGLRSNVCPMCRAPMNLPPATPEESAEFQELAQVQAQAQLQELAQPQPQMQSQAQAQVHSQAQAQEQAQEQAQAQMQSQAQAQSQLRRRMLIGITAYIGLMAFNQEALRETVDAVEGPSGSVLHYAVTSTAMLSMFLYAMLS